ncbi:hypothetical protein LCGC14_1143090 [marine sediment metagenome]|uniref:SF3 helicase domain-containing protein n=1 Tax=marine sediment metagenome TaxID=412755 RepID=A0A0F9MKQ4_9ZZZZ|nr:hypothetical protein [Phycisphaerae bacterium]
MNQTISIRDLDAENRNGEMTRRIALCVGGDEKETVTLKLDHAESRDLQADRWHDLYGVDREAVGTKLRELCVSLIQGLPIGVVVDEAPGDRTIRATTDIGNGERFVAQHGEDVRCVLKRWHVYHNGVWPEDDKHVMERMAKATAISIRDEAEALEGKEALRMYAHARRSEARSRIDAMIMMARSEPGISITPNVLDRGTALLNVRNGVVDLRTGALREHRRTDLMTKQCPVAYDPNTSCPKWLEFLTKIMGGNAHLVTFLRRAIGYSLTGHIDERCMFIPWGSGRNGKTTFLETIATVTGGYAGSLRAETLMVQRWDTIPSDVAALRGKRFVTITEAEENARLNEGLVKQITGGDTVKARFLYRELFEFQPEVKIWFATNHRPTIRGVDRAIWDRIRLIPFVVRIEDPLPRREVDAMFKVELAGILRWAVLGAVQWFKDGLQEPDEVIQATEQYRTDSDILGMFLDDCCALSCDWTTNSRDVFLAYLFWCENEGIDKPLNNLWFGRKMAERPGLKTIKLDRKTRAYGGLRIIEDAAPPSEWTPRRGRKKQP